MNLTNFNVLASQYPHVADWIAADGIEIAYEYKRKIVARAIDEGGIVWEGDGYATLDEAMSALERGIANWTQENFGG